MARDHKDGGNGPDDKMPEGYTTIARLNANQNAFAAFMPAVP